MTAAASSSPPPSPEPRVRAVVLLSGTGRTLENLLAQREAGRLEIDIPLVIASRAGIRGIEVAEQAGIDAFVVARREYRDPEAMSARVQELITPYGIDLLLLSGFLSQLSILPEWEGRMLNVHPSLLPLFGGRGFYGQRVHAAVLASGMKVSGCTVHEVNAEYDAGPIVAQRCVPVLDDDTPESLGARVFAVECELYPEAIRQYIARGLPPRA